MVNKDRGTASFKNAHQTVKTTWRLVRFIWNVDAKLLIGLLIGIIIPGIIPFINIYIYKLIIDVIVQMSSGAIPADFTRLYPLIGLRVVTFFALDAAFRLQMLMERLMWTKVPIEMNHVISKKISSLDVHHFEDDKFQDLLEKVKDSYNFRPQRLIGNLMFGIQSLVSLSIAFVALFHLNPIFIPFILLASVPEFITRTLYSKLAYGIWDAETPVRKKYYYLSRILQSQREVKEIRLFTLANKFLTEVKRLQTDFYKENKKLTIRVFRSGLGTDALSTLIFVSIEFYVVFLALSRKVTIGDISFYTGVVQNFQNSLNGLMRNVNEVFDSSLYVESLFQVLDVEPVIKNKPDAQIAQFEQPPVIEFKNVDFKYPGSDNKILDNFSLTINPGDKVAFVGENGAGKSTIVKLLVRFYDVDAGEILINGTNIKEFELDSWYKHVGVLFQDFNRYDYTAKDNIHFGNIDRPEEIDDIIYASRQAGADDMIQKYAKGYDQMLGKLFSEGMELSGGQWQKIALARAFFRNAPILVLDEPTSAIDAKGEAEIFERVEKLSKDKTVIIISHRFSTVRNADKIFVLDKGQIKESGSHHELMKKDGQYAKLFKLQAKGYQ